MSKMKQYIDLMTPMEAYEKGYNKAMAQLADMTEECKQMGRKEVVEWLQLHPYYKRMFGESPFEWQAKLKEWGVE